MTSTVRTPLMPVEARAPTRPTGQRRTTGTARSIAWWALFGVTALTLLGGLSLLAVRSVPAKDCRLYGSCAMAALMTYGAPE